MRIYAIGDIHGHLDLLQEAHARIDEDRRRQGGEGLVVHVGDLLDRGPKSRQVVDYLMQGQVEGQPWMILKGNHDRFLPKFALDPSWIDPGLTSGRHWIDHPALGAPETLASYGIATEGRSHDDIHRDVMRAVPESHVRWLSALPLYHLTPQALFVHAGIRAGVDLSRQTEQDMVWIRAGFLDQATDHGVLVVHGHTTVDHVSHLGNRLAIDTGAAYGGPLAAVVLEGDRIHQLTDLGREPVLPQPLAG